MKKFCRINKLLLPLAVLLLGGATRLFAQSDIHLNAAYSFIQRLQVDSAKKEIDLCMQDPANASDPQAWYLDGYIYKELYKKYENTNVSSPFRSHSLASFKKSIELDKDSSRIKTTLGNVRYLAGRFYNDAVTTLDTVHYKTSITCYNQYRVAALIADPNFDIKKKDIEFYLALASTYNSIYNVDKEKNIAFFDSTRNTYMNVLKWDANNYTANYNLGLLFWNKGVDIMYAVNFDDSLTSIYSAQDHSVSLFKQSLPFAEKAYEIEPKREETLIVLSGIYYSLNDFQKSKSYQEMLDALRKQK